ncbi:MAG: MarR family winged helix-turn-helix transcriptional regulator [Rhodococcus sp. (in: high G+C Gram-positive bacteria)]
MNDGDVSEPRRSGDDPHELVHSLRALVVQLDLIGAQFGRTHDLHATDIRALICLLDRDRAEQEATPGWLGKELGLNSASTTALVDRMERRGLVVRRRDTRDRRRVILDVSSDAHELGWSFFGRFIARAVDAAATFTPEQRDTVRLFLASMSRAMSQEDTPDDGSSPVGGGHPRAGRQEK